MSHAKTLALGNGWWLVAKHFTASCQFATGKLHALHCNNFRITAGFPLPFHMVHACMRSDAKILVREMLHNASGARDAKTVGSSSKHAQ
jgi:hypothetical protein